MPFRSSDEKQWLVFLNMANGLNLYLIATAHVCLHEISRITKVKRKQERTKARKSRTTITLGPRMRGFVDSPESFLSSHITNN